MIRRLLYVPDYEVSSLIVRKFGVWAYNSLKTIRNWERARRPFLKPFFLIRSFCTNFFVIILRDIIVLEISFCLSVNHNPELRCVICTGVTLFASVFHFLHWCYTWTALLSANQNRVIFFMFIINLKITLLSCRNLCSYNNSEQWQFQRSQILTIFYNWDVNCENKMPEPQHNHLKLNKNKIRWPILVVQHLCLRQKTKIR